MFTESDLIQIKEHNLSEKQVDSQLEAFRSGFPFLRLVSAATAGNGIFKFSENEEQKYIDLWDRYLQSGGNILKFVPASGAASRMFKALFSFLEKGQEPLDEYIGNFFSHIHDFAFFDSLDSLVKEKYDKSIDELINEKKYKDVIAALLLIDGLNYGNLPKALLKFHRSGTEVHTALMEHLEEGFQYAKNSKDEVNVHFTVSHEHRLLFEKELNSVIPEFEKKTGAKYIVSMSEQKPSTDTIAVNIDNTPYREDGKLLFRPGGHGALIENLNDVSADVVFIKNIDNVVPHNFRQSTIKYKKLIGGVLIDVQQKIKSYLELLESGNYTMEKVVEIVRFLQQTLNVRNQQTKNMEDSELVLYVKNKLNRPIRVCGVVKNEGEPGGGPYIAYNADGSASLQILESTQIDSTNEHSMKLMKDTTYFNPVDLVCYIRDYKGNKFNLPNYVDASTGFISEKSKSGHEIKALELPGLWNGAMSDWNTIFVEVPIDTFNPVKTVNDLLRPSHQ